MTSQDRQCGPDACLLQAVCAEPDCGTCFGEAHGQGAPFGPATPCRQTGSSPVTILSLHPLPDVIHTVGPIAQGQPSATQQAELSDCYKNSLKLAVENKLRTVAFPCISTGIFGYPNEAAADVVLHTLHQWLEENRDKVDRLILCVFLEKDEALYKEKLPSFFPVDASEGLRSQL
ncbi:hypothetical protein lerEdw1_007344 [Lerista edwardsae]|nr:hypothetical protein lerEdw1_007344 [Lerista edwardsae]